MNIHQLTVHYDPSEDRLLLRIGTTDQTEVQAWLTRRMTLNLAPSLPKVLARQMALNEAQEQAQASAPDSPSARPAQPPTWLDRSDLSRPYRPPLKILNDGVPLLVTDMDLRPEPDGFTWVVLKERRPERDTERKLELRLEPQMLQGLQHLINKCLPRTDWTRGVAPMATTPTVPGTSVPAKRLLN